MIQLRCNQCQERAVIDPGDYNRLIVDEGAIRCCMPLCDGVMLRFGHVLTKKRTIDYRMQYVRRFERTRNPRPTKKSRLAQEAERTEAIFADLGGEEEEEIAEEDEEWILPRIRVLWMQVERRLRCGGRGSM